MGLNDTQQFVNSALIKDLNEYDNEKDIDFIFYTGDLLDKGGKDFRSIEEGFIQFRETIISPLVDALKIGKERFIFVPGNHDIDRSADTDVVETGLFHKLKSIDVVNSYIASGSDEGILRMKAFKDFEREFHSNQSQGITNFQSTYKFIFNGLKIGIAAFNSAWRCYDSNQDRNRILLGVKQIMEANNVLDDCDVRMALMHHQFDYFANFESEMVQAYIENNFDALFCGHVHTGNSFSRSTSSSNILVSVAPSNSALNMWRTDYRYMNGYTIIDYDYENSNFTIHHRKYSHQQGGYIPNTDLAKDNGIGTINLQRKSYNKKKIDYKLSDINGLTEASQHMKQQNINNQSYMNKNAVEKVISIENDYKSRCFMRYKDLFENHTNEIFSEDIYFIKKLPDIDYALLVLDRIVISSEINKDYEFQATLSCLDSIVDGINSTNQEDKLKNIKKLYGFVEKWLELLKTINQESGLAVTEVSAFEWLSSEIKKVTDNGIVSEFVCEAKSSLELIKKDNRIKIIYMSERSLITVALISIIAPIYINSDAFIGITKGNIISPYTQEGTQILVDSFSVDATTSFERTLRNARGKELEKIKASIHKNNYTILTGTLTLDKFALLASVVSEYYANKKPIIVFTFKYTKNIYEMIKCLLDQINSYIVNKINLNSLDEINRDNTQDNNTGPNNSKYHAFKKYLNEGITRLVNECGNTTLVIDSLELFESHIETVLYFIQELPIDCNLLLSADKDIELIDERVYNKVLINVEAISRDMIPIVTGMSDNNEQSTKINNSVFIKSGGNIANLKKLTNLSTVDFSKTTIDQIFLDQIDEQKSLDYEELANIAIENEVLEEILLFLCVFEPIQPVPLDYIQLYLSTIGIDKKLPKIRTELYKIKHVISDVRFNRIRILNSEFAAYVTNKFYSAKDYDGCINTIFIWLSEESNVRVEFISNFLQYIIAKHGESEKIKSIIEIFIDKLSKEFQNQKLLDIGVYLADQDESDISLLFVRKAVHLGNPEAITYLAYEYMAGKRIERDIVKAVGLFEQASVMGNIRSKLVLSSLLFKGIEVEKDVEKARGLLEDAVLLGNKSAKLELAIRLLLGRDISADRKRGHSLLVELAEASEPEAMRILGNMLVYGDGIERNQISGEDYLKMAADKGSMKAKFDLALYKTRVANTQSERNKVAELLEELVQANYLEAKRFYSEVLIDGSFGFTQDHIKGLELLNELVDAQDEYSILEYARREIEGDELPPNVKSGIDMLRDLVNLEFTDAECYYGILLIDGDFIERDTDLGEEYLNKAASSGNGYAKRELARRYAYGDGLTKNTKKSEELFKELVSEGDILAKYLYAKFLLQKKGLNEEEKKYGIELIYDTVDLGLNSARLFLGRELLDGELIDQDINLGLYHLNIGVQFGETYSMTELGYRYLYGDVLDKDIKLGETLLRRAIKLGDLTAMTILGRAIILGRVVDSSDNAFNLLEKASCKEPSAMRILGIMLLRGVFGRKEPDVGKELLFKASQKGDVKATIQIAEMVLDGFLLTKDIKKGERILRELIEKGEDEAILVYSIRLIRGAGLEKDVKRGIDMLEKLSNRNVDAKFEYGNLIISGDYSVFKNPNEGEKLLRNAELDGHIKARRVLAQNLIDGTLTELSDKEGMTLLEKAIDQEDYKSMRILAEMYIDGVHIERNVDKAIQLFELSLLGDDEEVKVSYAEKLLYGDKIDKNIDKAISILNSSSSKGNYLARFQLAFTYIQGKIVPQNFEYGYGLLISLVNDGYSRAKRYLASMLIRGFRVERDSERGISLYEELIDSNDTTAIREFAELLIDGIHIPQDKLKGERLLKRVNSSNQSDASYELASRYLNGDGLNRHVTKGTQKLMRAVKSSKLAKFDYGIRLKKGIKIKKDETKGKEYIEEVLKTATTDELYNYGVSAYKLEDFELSTMLLSQAFERGSISASTSLAYLVRRGEARGNYNYNNVYGLLEKQLSNNEDIALINLVLTIISDDNSEASWRKADHIIRDMDTSLYVADWWYELSKKDDIEGHLVIAWLLRHGKINNNLKKGVKERLFKRVIEKGLLLPDWMIT